MASPAQTPRELLAELREAHLRSSSHRSKDTLGDLEPFLAFQETLGHNRAEIEHYIEAALKDDYDWSQELFNATIRELPGDLTRLFQDDSVFAIGTVDLLEVNARALRAPNGGFLIVLNQGLFTFLYKVARALATRFVAEGESSERPFGESTPKFEDTCRWIAEVFAWYHGAAIPFGPDFPIHPAQMMMANSLATDAERFVICHELAHHIMGHTNERDYKTILVTGVSVEYSDWGRHQEFEADEIGLNLLLREVIRTTTK